MVLACLMGLLSLGLLMPGQEAFDPFDATDDDSQTGIAVGERIPDITAVDQSGKTWTFDDFKGPNGAVILFHRSADW